MTRTQRQRLGLLSLCLVFSLSSCMTLQKLLTPPPAPSGQQACKQIPAALTEPVPIPRVCMTATVGEDYQDCAQTCVGNLGAANGKLIKIESELADSEKDKAP